MDNISLIRMEAGNLEDIKSVLSMFIDQVNTIQVNAKKAI